MRNLAILLLLLSLGGCGSRPSMDLSPAPLTAERSLDEIRAELVSDIEALKTGPSIDSERVMSRRFGSNTQLTDQKAINALESLLAATEDAIETNKYVSKHGLLCSLGYTDECRNPSLHEKK